MQKVNIIRDFHQDFLENRCFWPKEIWSKYTDNLSNFNDTRHRDKAVSCLNHLICDAMQHVPDVLQYLSSLRTPSVFRFCAIPQVMAIATLSECYNNPLLFERNIKIRRSKTAKVKKVLCKLFMNTNSIQDVLTTFNQEALKITKNMNLKDATTLECSKRLAEVQLHLTKDISSSKKC